MANPEPIYQDILETAVKGRYSITKFDDRNFIVGRLADPVMFRTTELFQISVSIELPDGDTQNQYVTWKSNQLFVCFDNTNISVGGISCQQSTILIAAPDAIEMLSKAIDDIFTNMLPLDNGS